MRENKEWVIRKDGMEFMITKYQGRFTSDVHYGLVVRLCARYEEIGMYPRRSDALSVINTIVELCKLYKKEKYNLWEKLKNYIVFSEI